MLKKTITYSNVDGDSVSKDLYFNISGNELIEKEAESGQTYSERLKKIGESNQLKEIYPTVLEMLSDGYGVRTEDGDFEKDKTGAAWGKFKNTLAFQALMDELLIQDPENNGNKLADFITAMLPGDVINRVKEQNAIPGFRPGADTTRPTPPVAIEQPVSAVEAVPAGESVPVSDAAVQPVQSAPAEPVVQAPETVANPSVIVQTSEPRTPELPGQAAQL